MRSRIAGSVTVSLMKSPGGTLDVDGSRAAGANKRADRLRQLAQLCEGLLHLTFAHDDLDGIAANDRRAHQADARFAQELADVILKRLQLLPAHVIGIHLQQDVRPPLQIEPEHDVPLRPFRPTLHAFFRKEIRKREQAADQCREQDRCRLPLGNVKHQSRFRITRVFSLSARPRESGGPALFSWIPACAGTRGKQSAWGALVFRRLALGAHARDHRAYLPHAHAVRNLDFDLVVIDHLGHLADQPT